MSPAYEEFLTLFRELERLWEMGKGESEEADRIRDQSDQPWLRMTEEERWHFQHAAVPD